MTATVTALHRAGHRHRGQHRLPAAVGHLGHRRRLPHPGRQPGPQGDTPAAPTASSPPATCPAVDRRHQPVGRRLQEDQHGVQHQTPRSTATRVRHVRRLPVRPGAAGGRQGPDPRGPHRPRSRRAASRAPASRRWLLVEQPRRLHRRPADKVPTACRPYFGDTLHDRRRTARSPSTPARRATPPAANMIPTAPSVSGNGSAQLQRIAEHATRRGGGPLSRSQPPRLPVPDRRRRPKPPTARGRKAARG